MYRWIWTLIFVIGSLIYYHFRKKLNYFKDRKVPYIPGWPLVGNMAQILVGRKNLFTAAREMYFYNKEAKYLGIFDFERPVVLLRELDLIKSVLVTNFDHFVDRIKFVDRSIDPYFGNTLFNLTGDEWRETRSVITPIFTSSKLKNTYPLILDHVGKFLCHVAKIAGDPDNAVEMKDLFSRHATDVMGKYAFGVDFNALENENNEFHKIGKTVFGTGGMLAFKLTLARGLPLFMKTFKIRLLRDGFVQKFKNFVRTQVQLRDEKGIKRADLIQSMIGLRDKTGRKMNLTKMTSIAFNIFFGSYETVATMMCLLTHELACNPKVQLKLQSEIDEVLSQTRENEITYDMINKLPYLHAVYLETQRKHPQVNFIDRSCTKRFELPPALPGGLPFVVEPGMAFWIPVPGIHADPQLFEEPERFWPGRFLDNNKQSQLLSFGLGPRNCVGIRTTHVEVKTMLFFLLAKFNLKVNDKTDVKLRYAKRSFFLAAEKGFWLSFELRNRD